MAFIFQYYVVVDEDLTTSYEGEINEILAGPFLSEDDANEWISSNPIAIDRQRRVDEAFYKAYAGGCVVVRAKVEVRRHY